MEIVRTIRRIKLPPSQAIVEKAFQNLGLTSSQTAPAEIKANFNKYLRQVFDETLRVLERYEESVYKEALERVCGSDTEVLNLALEKFKGNDNPLEGLKDAVITVITARRRELWQIFQSRAQSRKARGGKDWELQLAKFLELMNIPCERSSKNYRVDFILPNRRYFRKHKSKSFIISAKRTLRERWQEVIEELARYRAPNVYLVTADEEISHNVAKKITDYGVNLAVWDEVKKKFPKLSGVIGFSRLIEEIDLYNRQYWSH